MSDIEGLKTQVEKIESGQTDTMLLLQRIDQNLTNLEYRIDQKLTNLEYRIKDVERDQRTNASIASAVRSMGIFEKTPQPLSGSFFTEELNDIYG